MLCVSKRKNMNDEKLVSALNATGKECFVSYLEYFIDSRLSNEEIASIIQRERGYTHNSCRSRTSKARSILKNNRLKDGYYPMSIDNESNFRTNKKHLHLLIEHNQVPFFLDCRI